LVAGGCALDSFRSVEADQFNTFLNTIQAQCQPLQVGDMAPAMIPPKTAMTTGRLA
jgi:hypothetical protein